MTDAACAVADEPTESAEDATKSAEDATEAHTEPSEAHDEPTDDSRAGGSEAVDTSHLDDMADGCGCAEVWEHLSERRGESRAE